MLPLWVQWPQAILILIISCLGAWIAYKQVRIATAKLNLDLYDRRFEVFEAARSLVVAVLQMGHPNTEDVTTFNIRVADAVFLFEEDVNNYLDELRKSAVALHTKQEQLSAMKENDKRRNALIDGVADLEAKFTTEYEMMIAVFKPYLKLGNI